MHLAMEERNGVEYHTILVTPHNYPAPTMPTPTLCRRTRRHTSKETPLRRLTEQTTIHLLLPQTTTSVKEGIAHPCRVLPRVVR